MRGWAGSVRSSAKAEAKSGSGRRFGRPAVGIQAEGPDTDGADTHSNKNPLHQMVDLDWSELRVMKGDGNFVVQALVQQIIRAL